jgi:ribonuclease D
MMPNQVDIYRKEIGKPILADSHAAVEKLARTLTTQSLIAVDTEADSLFSYFEKVCLVQISTRGIDYLVDPLALEDKTGTMSLLAPVFADPGIEKVFHAAEYDIFCLKRDFHFQFANLFDTMIAARILGWKNVGLGNILQEKFGVALNKKMQRADWGARPLTDEQISYAREDTCHLLALRDLQIDELKKAGRMEEAREEFARLALVEPTLRTFDPDAYWHIDGARKLNPAGLGILRELYRFRDMQARQEDKPPFKILSDTALMSIALARPGSPRALAQLRGISNFIVRRYGASILAAVTRGQQSPQITAPRPHARNDSLLDDAARNRFGKLKEWRKARAAKRNVETDVIVSNDVLFAIARKNPRTIETLIEVSGLGPWKAHEYGDEMLAVLHGKRK